MPLADFFLKEAAEEELEREELHPVGRLVVLERPHHAGVLHPRAVRRFAQEPLHGGAVRAHLRPQDLDGAEAALGVLGAVDDRGTALADPFEQVVTGDDGTR